MAKALIDLVDIAIERTGCTVQRAVNWRVMPGEHWVILGPNGCGKTSIAAMLTGFGEVGPSAGIMQLLGYTYGASDWQALRKEVGVVSQAIAHRIEPQLTAEQVVATGREGHLVTWGRPDQSVLRQARRLLHELGASEIANRPWRVLSQGERQRALIARALLAKPKIMLLDEPCAGLDPVAREHFLTDLHDVAGRDGGPSLVMVTHHVEEIIPAMSHALILGKGRQVAAGPLKRVVNSHHLSSAYGAEVSVKCRRGRWSMKVAKA